MKIEFGDVFEYEDKELIVLEVQDGRFWKRCLVHTKGTLIYFNNEYTEKHFENMAYKGKSKCFPTEWFMVQDEK